MGIGSLNGAVPPPHAIVGHDQPRVAAADGPRMRRQPSRRWSPLSGSNSSRDFAKRGIIALFLSSALKPSLGLDSRKLWLGAPAVHCRSAVSDLGRHFLVPCPSKGHSPPPPVPSLCLMLSPVARGSAAGWGMAGLAPAAASQSTFLSVKTGANRCDSGWVATHG